MQTRVLVTGAAGFIGSHVADHCLGLGREVVPTDDLSDGVRANVPAARRGWRAIGLIPPLAIHLKSRGATARIARRLDLLMLHMIEAPAHGPEGVLG